MRFLLFFCSLSSGDGKTPETLPYSDFKYLFSLFGEISPVEKSLQESSDSLVKTFEVHRFPKASFGLCCNRKRTAAAAILLLGFFIVAFPTIVFAGHFSAREVAPVDVERELETEILHQQWSLNKTVPRERVVDRKKLVPEKKPNLETMAPVPGMFDVFLNHPAAAAIGFFIVAFSTIVFVAFSTIVFAGHFSAREVDNKKLVPEKNPNLETTAAVPEQFDVFLNHRGPDVKRGFAYNLYKALQKAGCRPFLDMESLEKGQHGQKKIYEALGCASVHVAIFSKDYAASDYCLDELCAMLESEKLIIPVFYDVSPNDLRCKLHNGPYTKAFRKIPWRKQASVKKWKEALSKAAQLSGFELVKYK